MRKFLVTGASGLIGSAFVKLVRERGLGEVVSIGRNPKMLLPPAVEYSAALRGDGFEGVTDVILAASPASPDLFVRDPDAVIKANTVDVEAFLSHLPKSANCVYVSSSEVYGKINVPPNGCTEDMQGVLDDRDARSCYAIGKRRAEAICREAAHRGLNVKIARPGHIYGPTAGRCDKRVSSVWAYAAAEGKDLVMKSDGAQLRSYTHCRDCATALLAILERGIPGEAYNIANRNSVITIRQMATILADAGGVSLLASSPTPAETAAFNPMMNSSLDPTRLESLGWHGEINAEKGLRETVLELKRIGGFGKMK